jgi:hypothetical protein
MSGCQVRPRTPWSTPLGNLQQPRFLGHMRQTHSVIESIPRIVFDLTSGLALPGPESMHGFDFQYALPIGPHKDSNT